MSSAPAPVDAHGAFMNVIRRLHFYIGLFIAPFIFVAALTGTLYVITPQIENVLYAPALTAQPQGEMKPLSAQIAVARHHAGENAHIYAVRPAPSATETTRVQFSAPDLGPSESRSVFVDPYSLQIKGDMTVYGTTGVLPLRMWLDQLHRGLLLGDVGRNYSELAASWLWVAALGGVLLWLNSRPSQSRKKSSGGFAKTRHWHVTLGLVLCLGLVFFSVTGLTWSQWAGGRIDQMRSELGWLTPQVRTALDDRAVTAPADPHAEHHGSMAGMVMPAQPMNRPDADWDRVLHSAREAGIASPKVELRQPKSADQAWTVTEVDRHWPSHVDSVSVNPTQFTVLDHVRFADFPLVAKLTRWGVDAHMGVLFGVINQLVMAAFGIGLCVMIALGYRMWWIRRPAVPALNPAQTLFSAWRALPHYQQGATLMLAVLLGSALPVMGISLLAFVLLDVWRWHKQHRVIEPVAEVPLNQQSPLAIVRSRIAVKRKEMRHFLLALSVLALVVLTVMSRAIIGGVIDEYHIPFADWSAGMYLTQGFMIVLYSAVFTGLMCIPLWYFFLGESDEQGR